MRGRIGDGEASSASTDRPAAAASGRASLLSYFRREKKFLALTAVTGMVYNVGMTAGPWFEGQLAQYLYDILQGSREARDLVFLSLAYVAVIALVQGARALKRLYVRKFANSVSRSMKTAVYRHVVHESYAEAQREDAGAVMTRAIADVEACAEGMRKFTTEIFDTGVVMVAYLVMLLVMDWRLTLIVALFPPIAYIASAALKRRVSTTANASREAMARLNSAAVDSVEHALTYRVYGEDANRARAYEAVLGDYERKNIAAGVWQNSPQPVYLVIAMVGVIPILYFGGANVLGTGWAVWSIATFSSFLSCFAKLATKSSHAAKLFNAVQKAEVSWRRIEGYLVDEPGQADAVGDPQTAEGSQAVGDSQAGGVPGASEAPGASGASEAAELGAGDPATPNAAGAPRADGKSSSGAARPARLEMRDVSFSYGGGSAGSFGLHGLNLVANPGDIVGIAGRVASGKSTFGKLFLEEYPHGGAILYGGREVSEVSEPVFAYAGHDPELFTGTVRENVVLAEEGAADEARLARVLAEVQIEHEVTSNTMVGMEGSGLSGGQQARLALARALYSRAPVLILDDPFAAVDATTERRIFQAFRTSESWRTILLVSHRIALFPQVDTIVYLEGGSMVAGTHAELMRKSLGYRSLYELQCGTDGSGARKGADAERGDGVGGGIVAEKGVDAERHADAQKDAHAKRHVDVKRTARQGGGLHE